MITEDGCWADYRAAAPKVRGRPCLFLDRDGVLVEDTGYPHDPATIVLVPETLDLVRIANDLGVAVGIVTNQSGIGRGYFAWDAFAAVQAAIDRALAARGGHLDFVLACPHCPEAPLPRYRRDGHPWRKPAPGMLLAAGARLGLDLARSVMVGDRPSDMEAGAGAGLRHRVLLDGKASDRTPTWAAMGRRDLPEWFGANFAPQPPHR